MTRDVVYMLRDGGLTDFEELRYSLRSLRNLPHGNVWIFGGRPPWIQGVNHVEVRQGRIKHTNTGFVMTAIADRADELSREFYLFHDDFFIMEPIPEVPRLYRSTWKEWLPSQSFPRAQRTQRALAEFGKRATLCYELHIPMIIDSLAFRDMMKAFRSRNDGGADILCQVQKRSLYGNWVEYGGERSLDCKIRIRDREAMTFPSPFLSTSDVAFNTYRVGAYLRSRFAEPSPHELPTSEPPLDSRGLRPSQRWSSHRRGYVR